MDSKRELAILDGGTQPFQPAWERQVSLAAARQAGRIPDTLFHVEHSHTLSIGVQGQRDEIHLTDAQARELGVAICSCDRGGRVTYHGPGQLVGYTIFDLSQHEKDLGRFLRGIEEVIIDTLADLEIPAERAADHTGVWVKTAGGQKKIAAIGIKVTRWIVTHGFSLNLNPDLSWYQRCIPCGIRDRGVTSLAELGIMATPAQVMPLLTQHLSRQFNFTHVTASVFPALASAATAG